MTIIHALKIFVFLGKENQSRGINDVSVYLKKHWRGKLEFKLKYQQIF